MTTRPSLVRSIPFWILIVGSLATSAVGAWLARHDDSASMTTGLTAGTATTGRRLRRPDRRRSSAAS